MVFASLSFIFLIFPIFIAADVIARRVGSTQTRNLALFGVSLFFYLWGEAANIFLLLALGLLNYGAGILLAKTRQARPYLILFVAINLAILIGFKYTYWLVSMIAPGLMTSKFSMPLGISFFTFHAISYLIDVYRKDIPPARTCLDFMTYFCMFPHLVAGPIVRYAQVKDDLDARGPNRDLFSFGMYRFLIGLNKKVIIANAVAVLADAAFARSSAGTLHGLDAWLGILAYTLQIYYDFSGYSDMAIGLAAMAGFHFEENFRRPYSSASIKEFWRRWHISLSSWLRDYLFIPLGGSRGGSLSTYRNLLLVFFLCGLWHGANFTFVVWGLWHGLFLVLEKQPFGRMLDASPRWVARVYTLLVVVVGWVFFRAENMDAALAYLGTMFTLAPGPFVLTYHTTGVVAVIIGGLLCLFPDKWFPDPTSHKVLAFSMPALTIQALLGVLSIALLLTGARNPFIYFDF